MELDDLAETIDRLVGSDPSSYADTEPVEALQRQLTRLHGFVTAANGGLRRLRCLGTRRRPQRRRLARHPLPAA